MASVWWSVGVDPRSLRTRRVLHVSGFPTALAVGADADVALVDPWSTWTVSREELLDRHRLSPFVGRRLRGRVVRTVLRGETVAVEGRVVGEPRGRVVLRTATAH